MYSICYVICEMILEHPLFQGENSIDQIVEIIKIYEIPSKPMNKNYKIYKFRSIKCFTLQ